MLKMYEEHPPTSLGNFSILQKKVHTKMPVSEGGWKCMKNSLPPPLSMHFNFKGWGMFLNPIHYSYHYNLIIVKPLHYNLYQSQLSYLWGPIL
jgi:hypothetical protein